MKIFALAIAAVVFAAPAYAQSLKLDGTDKPIDVTAEKGIELQQDNKRVIARGNAKAVQGEVTVFGDELIADYRTKDDGNSEVYRVFASGNVTMKSNTETATGTTAVYDFDKGVLVLEGPTVTLVNDDGSVVAHRILQYWSNERVAVAEGQAMAEDKDKRKLYGDKLIAFFKEAEDNPAATPANKGGKKGTSTSSLTANRGDISFIQGFGSVRMETEKEVVRGDRGTYNIETGIATLDGAVKITQNKNQLGGGFAVVNVKGGTSRLYGSAKEAGMQGVKENTRVSALIAPTSKTDTTPPAPTPTPAAAAPKGKQ
jgi:lipopolysaccharide export system protein LptA